jgi:hypothetical protein
MTSPQPPRPPTFLTWLFGPGDATQGLTRAIVSAGAHGKLGRALGHLRKEARSAAIRDIAAAAAGLLDVDVGHELITGWQKHRQLTAAAQRTLATPGSTELVDLVEYQVTSSQEPYVSVLIDGHQVATVQLGITVVFDITGMLAKITAGRLVAVDSGDCDITATMAIDGVEVITRQTRLRLPGAVPLHGGIRLLPESAYLPAAQHAQKDDDCRLGYLHGAQAPPLSRRLSP